MANEVVLNTQREASLNGQQENYKISRTINLISYQGYKGDAKYK
jgi:hypothetical protein